MAMSTKIVYNKIENKRRTLRSSSKAPSSSNNPSTSSNENKVIDQIKIEIEHQQTNNATKSSFPVHEEIKSYQQHLMDMQFIQKNEIKLRSQKDKCLVFNNNLFSLRPSEGCVEPAENSLEEHIKSSEELQKRSSNVMTPPAKSQNRYVKKTESSPYQQQRKSYRKIKKNTISLIPFRKCQDQFQHKIVVLINKICQNKHTDREIQSVCDKISRISNKDMYNPYIISGIQTIIKLFQKNNQANVTCLPKLKNEVRNLSSKIWLELGKTDKYETIFHDHREVDVEAAKPKIMRRIYKMLLQRKNYDLNEAKSKSFQACESFFKNCKNYASQEDIVKFLKECRFLQI